MRAIGVNTWVWVSPLTDADLAGLAPRLKQWGFDAVELPLMSLDDWDGGHAAEVLSANQLDAVLCTGLPPGCDLVTDDRRARAAAQAHLQACVRVAERVGSRVVAGPLYAPVGRFRVLDAEQRRAAYAVLADGLRPVADYAAERGIRLAIEPLNRYHTSLLNTTAQGLEVVELVGSPGCGLLLDTFHLNIEERDPAAAIRSAGRHLAHVQVCGNDRGAPGGDHLDWPVLLSAIDDTGYDGPLCIESFTAPGLAEMMYTWRPLADSNDTLAVEGLAFLRTALGGGR